VFKTKCLDVAVVALQANLLLNQNNPNLPLVILQCLHFREDKLLDRVRSLLDLRWNCHLVQASQGQFREKLVDVNNASIVRLIVRLAEVPVTTEVYQRID
jgi:hypothetical protein